MQFDSHELRLLHAEEEVEIETTVPAEHEPHRTTVWVVVVDSHAYVRSVNGERGHWYRHLIAQPVGMIHAGEHKIPVRAARIFDPHLQHQVSEEYRRKYAQYPHDVAWITGESVIPTTLRLERHEVAGRSDVR